MWTTKEIITELTRFQNKFDQSISESDYSVLALTIQLKSIIHKEKEGPDQLRSKSNRTKTISLEETNEEQWEEYRNKVETKLKKEHLKQQIIDAQVDQDENPEKK